MKKTRKMTALITGGSSGIGRALAGECVEHGYNVIIAALPGEDLDKAAQELQRQNMSVLVEAYPINLREEAQRQELFDYVESRGGGPVDILVNNAGIGLIGEFFKSDWSTVSKVLETNIAALTHLTHIFGNAMSARGSGIIVNIASTAAFQAGPFAAVYSASKAFVLALSEAIAQELKTDNQDVFVLTVCPGPTHTNFEQSAGMTKWHRRTLPAMKPERVAKEIFRAIRRRKRLTIIGAWNSFLAFMTRFATRRFSARLAQSLNRQHMMQTKRSAQDVRT